MSHFDGVDFGYDVINPSGFMPLVFEFGETEDKRPMLISENEYPNRSRVLDDEQLNPITEGRVVKKITPTGTRETFVSTTIKEKDIYILLLFVAFVVLVLQLKIIMSIDMMQMQIQMQSQQVKLSHL